MLNEKTTLDDLRLYKDGDGYYLSAEYTIDDRYATRKLSIPKIRLTVVNNKPILVDLYGDYTSVDIGFGTCRCYPDDSGHDCTVTTIKEKPQEMTLSEIEKKLGYKVKIVSE